MKVTIIGEILLILYCLCKRRKRRERRERRKRRERREKRSTSWKRRESKGNGRRKVRVNE